MLLRSSSTPVSQTILVESKKSDFDNTSADHKNVGKVSFHSASHLCSFSCNSSSDHQLSPRKSNNNLGRKTPRRVQSEGNLKAFVSKCDLDDVYRKGLVSKCDLDEVWLVSESDLDEVYRKGLVSKCDLDEVWLVSKCDLDEVYRKGLVSKCDLDEVYKKGLVSKCDLDEVYKKGLVSKCDLDEVYKKGLVSKCDLDEVYKKGLVSKCDLDEVYKKGLVSKCDLDEVYKKGLVSKCDLDEVYKKGLVSKCDLDEVYKKGLVSKCDLDEVYRSKVLPRSCHNQETNIILQTELSFSVYNDEDFEEMINDGKLVRAVTIGNEIEDLVGDDFSFGKCIMGLIKEDDDNEDCDEKEDKESEERNEPVCPMYLAAGYGIDVSGMNHSGDIKSLTMGGLMRAGSGADIVPLNFDEIGDVEAHYKSLLEEYPFNPLVLRNYAQLLQSKGDLSGAEEYYFQATLLDPQDGDILSQYATLVWQLHHDKDRALSYFEHATHVDPENSYVLAAYANFLWEINYDDNEHDAGTHLDETKEIEEVATSHNMDFEQDNRQASPLLNLAAGFGIGNCGFSGGMTLNELIAAEDYYKSMIQENPNNPLVLRNYAQFLDQCKGDLRGAEEYYSRAVLTDASDGEIISQYANFIWHLHHDQNKASSYFKRAVQASPGNCDVLASYARFLWETEEDEDEDEDKDKDEDSDNHKYRFQYFHGVVATSNA
uniref:O-linked n-acetylglucosamine transferase, ogt n=1 Tax=Solanum tuberosum TaxID=4113 RepID=M1B1N2_SOLTU